MIHPSIPALQIVEASMVYLSNCVDIEAPMTMKPTVSVSVFDCVKACSEFVAVCSFALRLHLYTSVRDTLTLSLTLTHTQMLRNFSVVRKLDGHTWPPGFEQAVAKENATPRGRMHQGPMWMVQGTERSLLTSLLAKLQALDPDVLVCFVCVLLVCVSMCCVCGCVLFVSTDVCSSCVLFLCLCCTSYIFPI